MGFSQGAGQCGVALTGSFLPLDPIHWLNTNDCAAEQSLSYGTQLAPKCPLLSVTLSGHAGFALRLAGFENVRILQGGFSEWKAKGGMDAAAKATH